MNDGLGSVLGLTPVTPQGRLTTTWADIKSAIIKLDIVVGDGVKTPSLPAEKVLDLLRRRIMKWLFDKNFAIPFGLGLLFGRFIDSVWLVIAVAVFLVPLSFFVEWLLKRKNKSFHFPTKDFLILSVLIFFFTHFIDSFWLYVAVVISCICVFFVTKWLLKRKTESEPEKI